MGKKYCDFISQVFFGVNHVKELWVHLTKMLHL